MRWQCYFMTLIFFYLAVDVFYLIYQNNINEPAQYDWRSLSTAKTTLLFNERGPNNNSSLYQQMKRKDDAISFPSVGLSSLFESSISDNSDNSDSSSSRTEHSTNDDESKDGIDYVAYRRSSNKEYARRVLKRKQKVNASDLDETIKRTEAIRREENERIQKKEREMERLRKQSEQAKRRRRYYSTEKANMNRYVKAKQLFKPFLQDPKDLAECSGCRLFIGSTESNYTQHYPFTLPSTNQFGITVITTSTIDRLPFLPYFVKRWAGSYSVAVLVHAKDVQSTCKLIKSLNLPDRFRIILYIPKKGRDEYGVFPVNKLRNIAIVNTVTSHFLILDMDMWPAPNLYDELTHLPSTILDSDNSAVIVPPFFLDKERYMDKCTDIMNCARMSNRLFPKTREELKKCIKVGTCLFRKKKTETHLFTSNYWLRIPASKRYAQISCFPNRFQEPYVMQQLTADTLFFDERFVDYGCNKVQYIDHLRNRGKTFYILTQSFAMDVVHQDSVYRKSYTDSLHSGHRPFMQLACYEYMRQVDKVYGKQAKTGLCPSQRAVYRYPKLS